jgi:hypothetical protein
MHPLRHDLNVPDYETSDAGDALGQHIRGFFAGHKIARRTWPLVPIETRIPGFFVYEIEPGPRFPGWTYVSSGYWRATAENGHGLARLDHRPGTDPRRGRRGRRRFAAARDVTNQNQAQREIAQQQARELDRLAELEQFQRLTVGRELKMIELKKEIEHLKALLPPDEAEPSDPR